MPGDAREDATTRETEQWFADRGLPHFIAHYRASTDIWTRALPALTLLFVAELIILAPNREFPFWLDVLVIAAMFVLAVGGWALVNRRRGRRLLARPDEVGPVEVAAFVIVPTLVPLIFGGQLRQALLAGLANIVILGAIYLVTSYALIAITRWGIGRLTRQLEAMVSLLARALPLIALLVTFLFLTQEVWTTAGVLDRLPYWLAVGLFPLVGVLFLVARLPRDVGELNEFDAPADLAALCANTPMETAAATGRELGAPPPLGRREWGNVGLVALFSQGVQITFVSMLIGLFFVLLGLLLVDESTTRTWAGQVDVLMSFSLGEHELVLTEELLRVAGFLTAFSGLNYTVYLVTDPTYRAEFREEVVGELRQAFAVRAVYLARLETDGPRSTTMSPT